MMDTNRLHALLIGIDAYPQGISSLNGCVNDIDAIQDLLIRRMQVDPRRIRRLVAPGMVDATRNGELLLAAPTYANIRHAFVELTRTVQAGERILVYFSGHGTQLTLMSPGGHRFTREAILPVDAITPENPAGRYIFDWELSWWLRDIARTAHVTMMLDCCSAAGTTRTAFQVPGSTARYHAVGQEIPTELEPSDGAARGLGPSIAAEAYTAVVAAACLDDERAIESGDGAQRHGEFTRALLHALADVPDAELAELRWSRIWSEVQASIAARSPAQHPWVSSNLRGPVFGGPAEIGEAGYALTRIENSSRVRIHAGTRAGVGVGAEIAIYGHEPAVFPLVGSEREEAARQATMRVTAASEHMAEAEITAGGASWPAGARGRMILAALDDRLAVTVPTDAVALAEAIERSGLLVVAGAGRRGDVMFEQLPDGRWTLTDDVYGPVEVDEPALPVCDEHDVKAAVRLAEHYARYVAPVRLARRCHDHPGALRVSLLDCNHLDGTLSAKDAQDPALPVLPAGQRAPYEVCAGRADDDEGDRFCLRIENTLREPLFVTVLDCDSDGSVSLLADRVHVRGGARTTLWHPSGLGQPFRAALSDGQVRGIDRFVCIATTDRGARFDHLELHATFASAVGPTRLVQLAQPPRAALTVYAATVVTAYLTSLAERHAAARPSRSLRDELGRGLAVVIGIDAYGGSNSLSNAKADAQAIGERLEQDHAFAVETYCDGDATLDKLRTLCSELPERAQAYEQVVIYFAGHGLAAVDDDGVLQGWLAPSDARFGEPDTLLAMAEVRRACEAIAAAPHDEGHGRYKLRKRHVLLLLDCCAAGALGTRRALGYRGQVLYHERYERLLAHRGVQFIGAADHQQPAADGYLKRTIERRATVKDHSPFATAVLAALTCAGGDGRGHAVDRNHDGVFLASELHDYVREELFRWTASLPPHLAQTPVYYTLGGHEGGDLVFAASKRRLLLPRAEQMSAHTSPYRGAASYEDSDRDERVLFGRDEALDALDQHVTDHRLTVVTGVSRTGKSSLVQAGLARRRRAAGWEIHRAAPGASSLAEMPATTAPRLVLVDPLDVLSRRSGAEASAFVAELERFAAERPNDRVVATLREGDEALLGSAALAGTAPRWSRWPLPTMGHEALRAVIEGPAETSVVFFEHLPGHSLVDTLIDRVLGRPGALALLSSTLEEMFQHQVKWRGDRTLRWADYDAVGGIDDGVVKRAEALYQASTEDQAMLMRIFVRLADVSGNEVEPRAVRGEDIGVAEDHGTALEALLERLEDQRLIVRGETIEVAHEAVLTSWIRVASLVHAERDALRVHAELADAAVARKKLTGAQELWAAASLVRVRSRLERRTQSMADRIADVFRPDRLVRRIRAQIPIALSRDEVGFLVASARRRTTRTLQRVALPFVAMGVAMVLIWMAVNAERARRERAMLEELNTVRAAASLARQDPRAIQRAVTQALDAIRTEPGVDHSPMLMQALLEVAEARASLPSRMMKGTGQVLAMSANEDHVTAVVHRDGALFVGPVGSGDAQLASPAPESPIVAISPRGTWVAYAPDATLRLWKVAEQRWDGDPIELQAAAPAGASSAQAFTVAFSGDEARVAVAFEGPGASIGVWNAATHERVWGNREIDGRAVLALDRTGDRLLAGATPGTWKVTLIDISTGHAAAVPRFGDQGATVAAFSPDGTRLAIGSPEGAGIWLLDGAQAVLQRWSGDPRGNVSALAFSDDGTRLAASTIEGDAVMWSSLKGGLADASARYLIGDPDAADNQGPVTPIVFGRDFIAALAVNGSDVQVWKVDPPLALELRHDGPVTSLAAPPSGAWLVTGAVDRTARVWSTGTGELRARLHRPLPVTAVAAGDTWFAAGGADRTVQMFNEHGAPQGQPLSQLSPVHAVAISPAGWIASASGDGTVVVADRQGAVKATFEHAPKKPGDAFSPDDPERAVTSVAWFGDDRLATAGNDGFVKVWGRDQRDPKVPMRAFHHGAPVRSLAWSPDGSLVLSTAADGTAMLWQLADSTGHPLSGHRASVVSGRFSSDGTQVVTASDDGTVRVWRTRDRGMIQIYDGLGTAVHDAAFMPGSCQRLVTASEDGTLRVWSTASGHELTRIAAHSGRTAGALVLLDQGRVATGGVDGSVRVFPTCTATVVRALCRMRDRSEADKPGPCPMTEGEEKACCSIMKEP